MRIDGYNQNFIKYTVLGAKSRLLPKKNTIQDFSRNLSTESNEKLGSSPLLQFKMFNNNIISQLGTGINTQPAKTENDNDIETIEAMDTQFAEELNAKRKSMNALLKKMGINGEVSEISKETVPQNYTMYYIETKDDIKNMLTIEFENGELMFIETEENRKDLFYAYEKARTSLGLDKGKLGVDELKKIFAKYFNVDELKDFILELSNPDKKLNL